MVLRPYLVVPLALVVDIRSLPRKADGCEGFQTKNALPGELTGEATARGGWGAPSGRSLARSARRSRDGRASVLVAAVEDPEVWEVWKRALTSGEEPPAFDPCPACGTDPHAPAPSES